MRDETAQTPTRGLASIQNMSFHMQWQAQRPELALTHGARWCKGYPVRGKREPSQRGDAVGCAALRY